MRVRSGGRGCKGSLVSDSGFGFVERLSPTIRFIVDYLLGAYLGSLGRLSESLRGYIGLMVRPVERPCSGEALVRQRRGIRTHEYTLVFYTDTFRNSSCSCCRDQDCYCVYWWSLFFCRTKPKILAAYLWYFSRPYNSCDCSRSTTTEDKT